MLKADQSKPLFDIIYPMVVDRNLKNDFMTVLTTYIEKTNSHCQPIPYLSDEVLQLLVRKYRDLSKEWVLENLIKDFDLSLMEPLDLLTLCLR